MVKEILRRRRFIPHRKGEHDGEREVPQNMWISCSKCHQLLYAKEYEDNLKVCPKCGHHAQLNAQERIATLLDEDSFAELDPGLSSTDPLKFHAGDHIYAEKLASDRRKTGQVEALLYGRGRLEDRPVVLAVHNFPFRGGSMGVVVGEKLARAIELAAMERIPLIIVSASGGARQDEGVLSLMQMAKTTAALARLSEAMTPYISLLTDPTIGGVPASYAMLGDVNVAEPGAYIGFAGKRVVEQTTRMKSSTTLPTAEFMLRHGMIDLIVSRADLRPTLARLLRLYAAQSYRLPAPTNPSGSAPTPYGSNGASSNHACEQLALLASQQVGSGHEG